MFEETGPLFYLAMGYAACAHRQQKRKYTGEPYIVHVLAVASIVRDYCPDDDEAVAAAILHDVIEDTEVTAEEINELFGIRVRNLVLELTDVSRPWMGNRKVRKQIDREHLAKSSPEGATIKLADLIDNTLSIVEHDTDFARVYLAEKAALLEVLGHGNKQLFEKATAVLNESLAKLEIRA